MQLRQTDQRRQEPSVDRESALERVSRGFDLVQLGAGPGEVQPQLGGSGITAAGAFEMLGRGLRVAARKRLEPERIARRWLIRIEREHRLEMTARVGAAAGLARARGLVEKLLKGGIGHAAGW